MAVCYMDGPPCQALAFLLRDGDNAFPSGCSPKEAPVLPASGNGHEQRHGNSCPFRRVLVAWDGSPDSVMALRTAAAIVAGTPGHVVAFTVLAPPPPQEAGGDGPGGPAAARRARQAFELARDSLGAGAVPVILETRQDRHVPRSLCDFAAEHAFDLLVLGRHGQGGILHPKLGHVAQETVRIATVPVLLVSAA
jgi:nucleotide-binding universal stress UspA family protein